MWYMYTMEYWWWCSIAQSCPTLCDLMYYSTPGISVPHHFLKFAQVHVHWISDAIQPSHPLMPSSSLNLSQCQGLFQRVSRSYQVTKILESQFQHQSFQKGWFPLKLTGLISLLSKRLSGVFPSTTVEKHQFFRTLISLQSSSHNQMWLLVRP